MYRYDPEFYNYIDEGASESARHVIDRLLETLPQPVESVLDVGCGAGAWLSVWKQRGARVLGIDGDYVRGEMLSIDGEEFLAHDLARGFELPRKFDLVQCLEVAEHLPADGAETLVSSLCAHADMVLFSAAPPGQGGENHINERPYSYWRDLFQRRGYRMYDPLRQAIAGNRAIKPWYRYNSFLYVGKQAQGSVHDALARWRIDPETRPPDVSPAVYRLRKRLLRPLPPGTVTRIAIWRKGLFNTLKKVRG